MDLVINIGLWLLTIVVALIYLLIVFESTLSRFMEKTESDRTPVWALILEYSLPIGVLFLLRTTMINRWLVDVMWTFVLSIVLLTAVGFLFAQIDRRRNPEEYQDIPI